ncbi:CvpA family protein [Taibaiella lutea]|uniref:CvpA family protein n=1 Tax=Taibaiella lutea TaxID=2608001 RepID=A0A5M6CEE6_9BACT|nr:CvpA family protein [Taibaiella lutea]KAA5533471.1 CvpA family protein [Taibaiella lutea]
MIIDVLYLIFLIFFLIRGYSKGIVIALFAVLSVIIGIFCAIKFSGFIANLIFKDATPFWVPFLSYVIVFIGVVFLVRLGAKAIDKLMKVAFLGFFNRICGALLYGLLITLVFSSFLWFFNHWGMIKPETKNASYSYNFLIVFAPKAFSLIGILFPFAKNLFKDFSSIIDSVNLPG